MCNKIDEYTDGAAITGQTIMTMDLVKYHSLQEEGVWNDMSPEQEILVALSSEVSQLKDHNLKLTKSLKNDKKADSGKDKAKKDKPKSNKKKSNYDKWTCKKIPPATGEHNTKCMPGFDHDYHWCDNHQAWSMYSAAECNLHQEHDQEETASKHTMPYVLDYNYDEE
jgi:hypothetical protein